MSIRKVWLGLQLKSILATINISNKGSCISLIIVSIRKAKTSSKIVDSWMKPVPNGSSV